MPEPSGPQVSKGMHVAVAAIGGLARSKPEGGGGGGAGPLASRKCKEPPLLFTSPRRAHTSAGATCMQTIHACVIAICSPHTHTHAGVFLLHAPSEPSRLALQSTPPGNANADASSTKCQVAKRPSCDLDCAPPHIPPIAIGAPAGQPWEWPCLPRRGPNAQAANSAPSK